VKDVKTNSYKMGRLIGPLNEKELVKVSVVSEFEVLMAVKIPMLGLPGCNAVWTCR
jgi:hypothetical protein